MSVTFPAGFSAGAAAAGLKSDGALDIALVVNDGPHLNGAAVFTSNRCQANPVIWSRPVAASGAIKAVALNSGGANCYTGAEGYDTTVAVAEQVAEHLEASADHIIVCSTGLIGVANLRSALLDGFSAAAAELSTAHAARAAEAIMTTDTRPKQASVTGSGWKIGGMAKGAGMLAPQLATMLVVITTDAWLESADLDAALREATAVSFDRLDSDGCMSTNDTVAIMASGASGIRPDLAEFTAALTQLCTDLSLQLLADAEGADHEIAIIVRNAATVDDALEVGRAVARSNLFKTAIFGKDPNWGRILASVGTTKAAFDPQDLDVGLNGVWVCRGSAPAQSPELVDLNPRDVEVIIDLKAGPESATIWTNDLTHAYVHENSAYSS